MDIFKRLKILWAWTDEKPDKWAIGTQARLKKMNTYISDEDADYLDRKITAGAYKQYAEFIMPDRAKELLSEKKDVSIDDLLIHE